MADATDAISPSVEPVSDIFDLGVINDITKAPDYADALPEAKAIKVTQWEENSRRLIQEYGQPDQIARILPKVAARAERERQRALGTDEHGLATLDALSTIKQSVGDDTSLPTQYALHDSVVKTLATRAQDRIKSAQIAAREESAAASATYAKTVSALDNIGEALNRKTNSTWEETKAFGNVVGNAASKMMGDVTEAVLTGGGSVIYGSERPGKDRPLAFDPKATNKFLTRALIDQSPADLKEMSDRTGLDVSDPKVFNTLADQFKSDFGRNEKIATVVSNGQVLVNPEHAFSQKEWDDAVDATDATPEAKAQAKGRRVEIRDSLSRKVYDMIYDIGGFSDFADAEYKKNPKIKDGEVIEKYKESRGGIKKTWTSLKLGVKEGIAGLSQSIYGFAGMVAPKWAGKDWLTQTAMDAGLYAGQQGEIGKVTGNYGLLQDVTSGATSISPYLVGGAALRVGKAAATTQQATMLATGFAHSAGSAYPEAYAALLASGKTPEEAKRLAKIEAVSAGASTALTMKLFPEGAAQAAMGLSPARTVIGGMAKTGAHEVGQEATDQLLQGLTKQQFSNPTGTAGGVMGESLHAGGVGGIVGVLLGGANAASNAAESRIQAARLMDAAQAQAALAQQAGLPQTAAEIQALAQQAIASFPVGDDNILSTKATVAPTSEVERQIAASKQVTREEAAATGHDGVQAIADKLGVTWDEAVQVKKDARDHYFGPPKVIANTTRGVDSPQVKAAWSDATTAAPITATWSNKDSDQPVKIVGVLGEKDGEVYLQTDGGTGIPASQVTRDAAPAAPSVGAAPTAAAPLRGWEAQWSLATIAQSEGVDLSSLSREQYADYAISKGHQIDDTQLRMSASLRTAKSMEEYLGRRGSQKATSPEQVKADLDFANFAANTQKLAATSSEVAAGVRVRSGTAGSNSWLYWKINNGTSSDKSTPTHKAYAGFSDVFKSLTPERVTAFLTHLQSLGYNGDVKTIQDLATQNGISDQIVMHGATEADAQLALKAVQSFFGAELNFTDSGMDHSGKSHSQILAEKIKNQTEKKAPAAPAEGDAFANVQKAPTTPAAAQPAATSTEVRVGQMITHPTSGKSVVVTEVTPMDDGGTAIAWANPDEGSRGHFVQATVAPVVEPAAAAAAAAPVAPTPAAEPAPAPVAEPAPTVAAAEADIATAKKASDAASDALFKAQETLADKRATLAASKDKPSIAAKIQKKVDEQQAKVTKLAAEQQTAENAHRALLGLPEKTTGAEAAKVEAPKVKAPVTAKTEAPATPKVRKPVVQAVKAAKPVEKPVAPKVEAPKAAEPVVPTPVAPTSAAPASTASAKFNPQVGDKVYYQPPEKGKLPVQVEVVAVNGDKITTLSEPQRKYGMAPRVVTLSALSATPQTTEEAMRTEKAAKIVAARRAPKAEQEIEDKPESTKGDYTVSPQQTAKQLSASIAELVNKQTPAEREAAKEKWAAYLRLANPDATPKEIAARVSEMEKTAFPEKIEAVLNKQMGQGLNKVRNMLPAEQGNILMDVVSGPKGYMENLKNYGSPFVFLPEQGKTAGQIHAGYSIAMNMKRQAGLELSARTGKGGAESITTPEEGAAFMNTPLPSAFNDLATDINAFKEEEITFEPPVPEHPALEGIPDAPADTTEAPAPVVELPVSEAAQKLADHVWDEYFAEPVEETIGAVIKRWGMTPEQAEYAIRRMLDLHMDMLTRQKGLDAAGRERSAFGRFTPGGNPVLVGGARAVELTKHTVNKSTNETTYEHPDFHAFVRDEIFDHFADAYKGSLNRRGQSAVKDGGAASKGQTGTAPKTKRSTIADDGGLTEQSFASLRQDEVVTSVGATLNRIAELQRSGLLSADGAAQRRAAAIQMLPQAARDLVNAAMERFKLGTSVSEGLIATSKDEATSEPTRLLASALVKANPSLTATPLDIGMQDANEGGAFDPDSGAVSVNPIQHADRIGDTTVHEALHAIGLETVDHYLNEDFDKITPAQKEALDALSTLLESAQQQTLARDGITADTTEHPTLSGEALRAKVYGLTDLGEFINEVLTNEGFRTHLETLQAPEGTSFKGRLKNMWAAVRAALRKLFIGRDIDSTSLLAHAIDHALAFTQSVSDGSVGTVLDAGGSFVWSIGKLLKDNGRFGAAKSVRADGTMAEKDFEKAIERGNIPLAERDMLRTLVPEAFDKGVVNVRLLEELLPQRKPIVSFTYGMDTAASALRTQLDTLRHEWLYNLRGDLLRSVENEAIPFVPQTPLTARMPAVVQDALRTGEITQAELDRYVKLTREVDALPSDDSTSPRATSAYNSVSSIDPAALKTAGGESIKISVALPTAEAKTARDRFVALKNKSFTDAGLTLAEREELNDAEAEAYSTAKANILHYADALHESGIPNTLGWAWLHVVPRNFLETWAPHTLVKGGVFEGLAADGKVMLLDEQQSAWGQSRRDALEKSKRADNNEWSREEYKKSVADHPLLDVQHYLVLKQAIAEADKRGITLFAAPDSKTAMQTEMHDQLRSDSIGRYDTLQEAQAALQQAKIDFAHDGGEHPDYADYTIWMVKEGNEFVIRRGHAYPTQADGMDIHYNTTIQSALRNLTGDAGTPAALGVHKNTETDYEQQSQVFSSREAAEQWRKQNDPTWVVRERFLGDFGDTLSWTVDKPVSKGSPVFKDAQGNPKKDVTVTVYDLRQAQATMHKQGGFTLASKRRSTLPNRVQSKPLDEANSTALRSVWDRLPTHLKQQVKYQPTTEDADFDAAGKWLNENPRTPADQLAVLLGNGNPSLLGLTGREKIAAITLSLTHLIKINADIDSMNPADVSEDLQQARHELGSSISDYTAQFTRLASNTGGDLQAIHMAMKKILGASPEQFIQTAYVAPTEKVQAENLTGNKDAKAVKASVKKAKATAATRATDRMTGVFAKLMQRYLGDQAQTTFDFFNDVIGIPASQQARTLEERKAALVDLMTDRLATQLRLHAMLNDQTNQNPTEAQQEAMNRMIADVRREVAAQIDRVMASDAGANTTETPEQRSERLLSQAAAAFGRSDMAAQVFDAAKQRIMTLRENSLPEIQKIIDERVASAQFDPAQIKKFSTAIKQLADFRTMARSSYQSQEKTRVALAEQIWARADKDGTPLSDAQKAQLRTVLETVFNAEMASAVQDEIAALKKRYLSEKKSPINELDPVRLTRLFAQGALSDAELYNAIAPAFDLPAYDPALIKTFTDQARQVRGLPPNSVMADDAQTALMKEIGRAHRRQAVGKAKQLYRWHVIDSLWVAGALSGPPTHVVNLTMTAANVFMDLHNLALAQYQQAVRNGMDKAAARQFFTDSFRAWRLAYTQGPALAELAETGKDTMRSIINSPAILEARAALSTGHTRQSTESSDSIMPLEYYDFAVAPTEAEIKNPAKWANYLGRRWLGLNKFVGRALLAEDSLNRIVARSGAELMYMRAALLEDAETGHKRTAEEMKDLMQPFVSPTSADVENLRAQVAQEEAIGHFDHIPENRREFAKTRRFTELKNQRISAAARRDAEEFAAKATFNSDAKGVIGMMLVGGFGTLTNKIPGPWGRIVIPFTRIITNLANAGLDYTPYGWARAHNKSVSTMLQIVSPDSKYAWQKIEPQSVEYFQTMNRATFGTAFLTGLMTLIGIALQSDPDDPFFDITGDGPDDLGVLKQLEQNRDANNNPTFVKNSIKVRIGTKTYWWRHSDFPGINMGLAAIGAFRDAYHYEKEGRDKQHRGMLGPLAGGLIRSLLGKNMLSGALDLFTAIAKGGQPEGEDAGMRLLGSAVSGYAYPQAIKFAQNATSTPVDIRDQSRTWGGWLIAQTPALPYVGRPAFNILGEPLKGKFYDMSVGRVAPTLGSEGHSIIDPLTDAGINIPVASPFKLKDGTELTKNDPQFYDFSLKYGQTMKSMLTPQVVQQLVNISKTQGKDAANKAISSFAGRAATRAAQVHVRPMLPTPAKP